MVEFAIILPVFIILIFGIIEFSILLYNKGIITHAAREGARLGVVYDFGLDPEVNNRKSETEIRDKVDEYIANNLISFSNSTPNTEVITDICPNQTASEQELIVRVEYPYSFLVLPNFVTQLAGGVNLQSEAVMICE